MASWHREQDAQKLNQIVPEDHDEEFVFPFLSLYLYWSLSSSCREDDALKQNDPGDEERE